MGRSRMLVTFAVVALSALLAAGAAAVTPPRGTLTKLEYRQFHAIDQAMRRAGRQRGTPTQIARHTCHALTDATRLTSAERGECEASLIFSYRFFAFPYELQACQKVAAGARRARCVLGSTSAFERAVRAFIHANTISARAAAPRHFSRRCLDYLLFTPQQAKSTIALAAGLQRYEHAVRSGQTRALNSASTRLDSELVASRQAMSLSINVSVCRHQ